MIDTKKAKSFREYFKEYVILGLVVSVITLFKLYYNLNDFIIHTLIEDHSKMELIIEKNSQALQLIKTK